MSITLLQSTLASVLETFSGLWPLLLISMLISVVLKLYVDQERVGAFLRKSNRNSVAVSTLLAVGTPFCSCGTTAVVLGMLVSTVPWAPIVAFLVASPLTSPQQMVYSAGLFGWPFAVAFMLSSIVLGLAGGAVATYFERRGWLKNQARLISSTKTAPSEDDLTSIPLRPRITAKIFLREFFDIAWKLTLMFLVFSFIGYFLNGLIPAEWIKTLFGSGRAYSIPLAALLGLPFYLNTEASMPMVRAFMDSGMSAGAALAFLITGAGTSIGAFAGILTIARWRVIAIVVATLVGGAMLSGFAYNLLSAVLG